MNLSPDEVVRFEAKYEPCPTTGCWLWLGAINHNGYGVVSDSVRQYRAHRYAYKLFIGEIPPGHFVCHVCDVRCCVNPAHLFLGSHTDNMRDRSNKGRYNAEFNGRSKLSRIDIQRIREMSSEGVSYKQLAMSLGVSKSAIYCVVKGLTWKHIPKAN